MKKKKLFKLSQQGFTLVELLIVIVIIGILAGVVIGVLNPVQQQNRARDSVARAQLDKMALAGKGLFTSSPRSSNRSPSGAEFISGLGSVVNTANCVALTAIDNTAGSCVYEISGQKLATDCTNTFLGTGGAVQCNYVYWRNGTSFRIGARGMATPISMFVYEYVEPVIGSATEGFYMCAATFNPTTTSPNGAAGCSILN